MNFHSFNGAPINGSRVAAILAAAAFACTASLSATGARQQDALAPSSSSASFTANATLQVSASAVIEGLADLQVGTRQVKAAESSIQCSAELRAFVLRDALGFASFGGAANFSAIPASVLGGGSLGGIGSLAADATYIHNARGAMTGSGAIAPAPAVVTRWVVSQPMAGTASMRAEPAINGVLFSYADIEARGGLSVSVGGLVRRPAAALIAGSAVSTASATHVKPGRASAVGVGAMVLIDAHTEIGVSAAIMGEAAMTAGSDRILMPLAGVAGQAAFTAAPKIKHGSSAAAANGGAEVSAVGVAYRRAMSTVIAGSATLSASGVRSATGGAFAAAAAEMAAVGSRVTKATAGFDSASAVSAAADITIRIGAASIDAGAGISAASIRLAMGEASIGGEAVLSARSVRELPAGADLGGAAEIIADTVANPDSSDPPSRAFFRSAFIFDFIRPAQETHFRRSA